MKINDIIVGNKKRKHRNSRKHRMVQKDLYTADPKHLGESKGRDINHLEDLVVFYGSKGGKKAIDVLKSLETSPESVTIKWDGRPAVILVVMNRANLHLLTKVALEPKHMMAE